MSRKLRASLLALTLFPLFTTVFTAQAAPKELTIGAIYLDTQCHYSSLLS